MFAMLGEVNFKVVDYFESISSSKKVPYASHEVIEGKPLLQFIGDDLEELDLEVNLHADFCSPKDDIALIEKYMMEHSPQPFVYGNGEYINNYVIEEITKTIDFCFDDGTPISIGLKLKLKEFVKPKEITGIKTPKRKGEKVNKKPSSPETPKTDFPPGKIVRQK